MLGGRAGGCDRFGEGVGIKDWVGASIVKWDVSGGAARRVVLKGHRAFPQDKPVLPYVCVPKVLKTCVDVLYLFLCFTLLYHYLIPERCSLFY